MSHEIINSTKHCMIYRNESIHKKQSTKTYVIINIKNLSIIVQKKLSFHHSTQRD